jgi:ribosome-binding factor A
MASRRLEKVSRSIQSTVSDVINNQLSDPRVKGMISVTRVDASPDLRNAKVYLSILGVSETQEKLSIEGIKSASGYIRTYLARRLTMKMCPALDFILDEGLKNSFATMQLLNQVSQEISSRDSLDQDVSDLEENSS